MPYIVHCTPAANVREAARVDIPIIAYGHAVEAEAEAVRPEHRILGLLIVPEL